MTLIAHPYVGRPEEDRLAHLHAVALALAADARLLSVHAASGEPVAPVPAAREVLAEWGRADASVPHELRERPSGDDPVEAVLEALAEAGPALVVLGTTQRKGALRVFLESRAETIAENLAVPALLIPTGARGFVGADGALALRRVVVPCGDALATQAAMERLAWLVERLELEGVQAALTHVGDEPRPELAPAPHPQIEWSEREIPGELEDALAEAASRADLVVMATRGHDSWADRILGSHTERLLRLIDCPLLSVPLR